jgi:hypothetical protein
MENTDLIKMIITELDKDNLSDNIKSKLAYYRNEAVEKVLIQEKNILTKGNILSLNNISYNKGILFILLTIMTVMILTFFMHNNDNFSDTSIIDSEILTGDVDINVLVNPDFDSVLKKDNINTQE